MGGRQVQVHVGQEQNAARGSNDYRLAPEPRAVGGGARAAAYDEQQHLPAVEGRCDVGAGCSDIQVCRADSGGASELGKRK
eukprot:01891_3